MSKSMSIAAVVASFAAGSIALNAQTTATWGGGSGISIESESPDGWNGLAPRLAGDVGTINSGNVFVVGSFNWLGTLNVNSGATLDLSAGTNNARWANVRLNGGRIGSTTTVSGYTFGNSSSVIELIGNNNELYHYAASSTSSAIQIDAALTGTGGIIKRGLGTVRLRSAGNTFSGDLRIEQGQLFLWQNAWELPNATVDLAGGTLGYYPSTEGKVIIGGLKGDSNMSLNNTVAANLAASEFRVGRNGQSTTYSGNITVLGGTRVGVSDKVAFIKEGTGTLTLSGNSTYPGDTIIEEGVLLINGQHNDSDIIVKNGGALGGGGVIRGNITFEDGAGFQFDILKTLTVDKPDAIIDFGTLGIADIRGLDTSALAIGDIYTLITGAAQYDYGLMSNVGIENAASIGGGLSAYFVADSGLQLVIIPEASTVSLVGLVFFSALVYRARRK